MRGPLYCAVPFGVGFDFLCPYLVIHLLIVLKLLLTYDLAYIVLIYVVCRSLHNLCLRELTQMFSYLLLCWGI